MVIHCSLRNHDDEDYFALFDGHNGVEIAKYCSEKLHLKFSEILEKSEQFDPNSIFKNTFELINSDMQKLVMVGGTTAVVAYFIKQELFIANVGDSRAVLCQHGKAIRVTTDHKPDVESEKDRIIKSGGWVKNGAITGSLTVSRALGDFSYKPYITCDPDVFGPFPFLEDSYQFLIIACDGLWDAVTDEEAVAEALTAKTPEDAAVKLRDKAFHSTSKDNISVLVIYFPQYRPPEICVTLSSPEIDGTTEQHKKKATKTKSAVDPEKKKKNQSIRQRIKIRIGINPVRDPDQIRIDPI